MKRRSSEGFTLIEVMMAMAVMVIGALGILSMQQAATRGNMTARQLSTASYANQVWLERVRRDALMWNGRNRADTGTTTWLAGLAAGGDVDWFTPAVGPLGNESAGFDYFGNEVPVANATYCTHLALNWISVDGTLARVTARTWWHRRGDGTDPAFADRRLFPNCGQGAEPGVTAELADPTSPRLRAVTSSILVRWNRLETP